MNREDYIWVGIRIFGIWLAVLCLGAVLSTVGSALHLYVAHSLSDSSLDESRKLAQDMLLNSRIEVGIGVLRAVVYGSASWYMLRRGAALVGWVAPGERAA